MKKAKTMDAKRANKQVKKKKLMPFLRRNKNGKLQLIIKRIIKENQKMLLKQMKNIIKKDLVKLVGFILLQTLNKDYILIMIIVKKMAIKRMNYQMNIKQKLK